MKPIPIPFTDLVLLLSTPAAWLVLAVVPIALIVWLYRYELKLVSRWVASTLLGLRLVVLFVVLFLLGVKPILARTLSEDLSGRVIIAVDRSDSMEIHDPQRSAVERLRLARALHIADDICSPSQLDDWIRQYDEHKEIRDWAGPNDPPSRIDERQRLHAEVTRRVEKITRTEITRRLLMPEGGRLLQAISARHKVELMGFAQETWDVKPEKVNELFEAQGSAPENAREEKKARARASAYTDLRSPLVRALERSGSGAGGKVLGIVLLTDGQHNWRESPVAKAIELGNQEMPIYPIAIGARLPPPDVALISGKGPPTVFKDVDASIDARLKISGLPAQEVLVELQREGQPPLQERIQHDGKDRYYPVRFSVRLDKVGTQALTVAAKPALGGEISTDNNSRSLTVNVADDKAKVLLIDGEARWEYHYLANALVRDRTMKLENVVFSQPRLGRMSEEELANVGNPKRTLPSDADTLAGYDCIILGDVAPTQLSLAERQRLEKFVADRGGTLVLLAGKRAMPLAYKDEEKIGGEDDPLVKLLPIEQPREIKPLDGFKVTLTHEGKGTPFLQMDSATDKSEERWAELPAHYWGLVGKTKPGAVPLAYYLAAAQAGLAREPGAPEKENALIARHNYGFGRVLFVGLDSTWRWRYKIGDLYHHRFWGQVIRWAASDKPLVTGNEFVRFGTREPVYQQGQQDVEIVARLGDEAGTPQNPLRPESLAGARILHKKDDGTEEAVALVPLTRREAQPRVLEGRLRDRPPGQYQIELVIPELGDKLNGPPGPDGKTTKMRASFRVTQPESEEMVELATKWPLLEELASKSGGKLFTPEDASQLVELLKQKTVKHTERTENRLWQWWVTLVVLMALLTVEWVARKCVGLP